MATKVSGKKATGTRKRKERKNIERGAVHINPPLTTPSSL